MSSALPDWLLSWGDNARYFKDRTNTDNSHWLQLLDDLKTFQKSFLKAPYNSRTLQELLALIYAPYVREGFSINATHGSLKPSFTLTKKTQQVSKAQFLPALVDVLQRETVSSFSQFIQPLEDFLRLEATDADVLLKNNDTLIASKSFRLPRDVPKSRRRIIVKPGDEDEAMTDEATGRIRIRPGQFGTSGQSRRAYALDTLAAASLAAEDMLEDLSYLNRDQRAEIARRFKVFRDEAVFSPRDSSYCLPQGAAALSEQDKLTTRTEVVSTLQPLFSSRIASQSTFQNAILGLLRATDNELSLTLSKKLSESMAQACLTSNSTEECMEKIRSGLCADLPQLAERLASLGFPIETCLR